MGSTGPPGSDSVLPIQVIPNYIVKPWIKPLTVDVDWLVGGDQPNPHVGGFSLGLCITVAKRSLRAPLLYGLGTYKMNSQKTRGV